MLHVRILHIHIYTHTLLHVWKHIYTYSTTHGHIMQSHTYVDSGVLTQCYWLCFTFITPCADRNEVDAHFSGLDRKSWQTQPAASEIPHRRVEEEECVHVISLASGKWRNNFNRIQPHVFASKVLKSSGVFFFFLFLESLNIFQRKKWWVLGLTLWIKADIRDRLIIYSRNSVIFQTMISDKEAKSYHDPTKDIDRHRRKRCTSKTFGPDLN